jgi:hypothetical protein
MTTDMISAERKRDIVFELATMLRDGIDKDVAIESVATQYGLVPDEVRTIVREARATPHDED